MKISKIRVFMEHNKILKKFIPCIRKMGIVHFLHIIGGIYSPRKHKKNIENFLECYEAHKEEYKKVYNLLEDEESRKTYQAVLKFRKTYKYSSVKEHIYYPQYFVKEIFKRYESETFVDGGAYTGDTIFSMLDNMPTDAIRKIYAWEPDEGNGAILQYEVNEALARLGGTAEVEWIPCALYKEGTTLKFVDTANGASKIGAEGSISVKTDTIDHRYPDATFIKMDIEGAEIDALYGAKNTIINNKPKLAICIYHSNEHLYEIPLLIHKWVPEYRIYVRHHSYTAADTVMYAQIPE